MKTLHNVSSFEIFRVVPVKRNACQMFSRRLYKVDSLSTVFYNAPSLVKYSKAVTKT